MQIVTALTVEAVRQNPGGRVDLIGLFEDIYTESVPVTAGFRLFLDFELTDADVDRQHEMEIEIRDAEDRPIQRATTISFHVPFQLIQQRTTAQLDLDFPEILFHRFGPHRVHIRVDGVPARQLHLSVQRLSPA